jgi:aspartyl-tRNA(Asn)/glutamyl-tRNA(Gln) amidotransferase subunit C
VSLDIDRLAELAHIKLDPKAKEKLSKDLEGILAYVEQLKEVDTKNIAEMSHVFDAKNVYRPDVIVTADVRDKILKHAPEVEGKFLRVPKIVER